jgi:hypothetical protein
MKQCFSLFLALGLAVAAGCSSDQPGPDAGNSRIRTESGFCTEWARVVCNANVVSACEFEDGVDECRDFELGYCLNLVPSGYRPNHAQDCINAAKTAYSDATITAEEASEVLNLGGECSRLVDGGTGEGDACGSDFDCDMVDDNRCVIKPGDVTGTCQVPELVGGGERCDDPAAVCEEGFFCDVESGRCFAILEGDDACTNDAQCGKAARCIVDGNGTGLCTPKGAARAVCVTDSDCVSDFCVNERCRVEVVLSLDVPALCLP